MKSREPDDEAFDRGCRQALESPSGLLRLLFSARTQGLFQQLESTGIHSFLSGLIVGSELKEGMNLYLQKQDLNRTAPNLIGEARLIRFYQRAFALAGIKAVTVKGHPITNGLFHIARAALLL